MADFKKYSAAACGHMFAHFARTLLQTLDGLEYPKYGNENIVPALTGNNYNLAPKKLKENGEELSQIEIMNLRKSQVKHSKRKDLITMISCCITMPKTLSDDDFTLFFRESYNFLSNRYGAENVISCYVHMDEEHTHNWQKEISPHMHFSFCPVIKDSKNEYHFCAKKLLTRTELRTFHRDYNNYMTKVFGRDIGVYTGVTKQNGGNKSVQELLLQEHNKMVKQNEELANTIDDINSKLDAFYSMKGLDQTILLAEGNIEKLKKVEKERQDLQQTVSLLDSVLALLIDYVNNYMEPIDINDEPFLIIITKLIYAAFSKKYPEEKVKYLVQSLTQDSNFTRKITKERTK